MNHLFNDPIGISSLRQECFHAIVKPLSELSGKKLLVLDKYLMNAINLLVPFRKLVELHVTNCYMLDASTASLDMAMQRLANDELNILFLCRPDLGMVKHIVDYIRADQQAVQDASARLSPTVASALMNRSYTVFFLPRVESLCQKMLLTELSPPPMIRNIDIPMFPFDVDLLSMHMPGSFRDMALHTAHEVVHSTAMALLRLKTFYGPIPRIMGVGPRALECASLVRRIATDSDLLASSSGLAGAGKIDCAIIIDRMVDPISPLVQTLTFEGLIDHFFGIDASLLPLKPAVSDQKLAMLDSSDTLYSSIRDLNLAAVGPALHRSATRIDQQYDRRHAAKTISQIREFVSDLGGLQKEHQSLGVYTNLAEHLMAATRDSDFLRALQTEQGLLSQSEDLEQTLELLEELIFRQSDALPLNRTNPLSGAGSHASKLGPMSGTSIAATTGIGSKVVPAERVLRLMSLLSLTQGGLKPKVYKTLRAHLVGSYGYEIIYTLLNFERAGLIFCQGVTMPALPYGPGPAAGAGPSLGPGSFLSGAGAGASAGPGLSTPSAYPGLRKHFHLFDEDVKETAPEDISYVHSGYAPLSVRLVERMLAAAYGSERGSTASTAAGMLSASLGSTFGAGLNLNLGLGAAVSAVSTGGAGAGAGPGAGTPVDPEAAIADRPAWRAIDEALRAAGLPGPLFDMSLDAAVVTGTTGGPGLPPGAEPAQPKTVLVVYLGGCTWSEVAALRFLTGYSSVAMQNPAGRAGSSVSPTRDYITLTTQLLAGRDVTSLLSESLAPRVE
ncbi:hypothetical protein H696_02903 [Fonticula alba]|uniref:Uncharacterized protein n=1 Tax=Fonticula alba TaxID=691883 RepID=A0A058ZAV5_FONAL|nr:hypothetical protein H696_02903 [Fonticula alba]KCV70557.1 hypothetical protein H696_02903 [Fonticula alba]|eukprot:XP_009495073.1 hypothetical protein H696_02903 [Fonticula alba]